jgi:hypothetical protein
VVNDATVLNMEYHTGDVGGHLELSEDVVVVGGAEVAVAEPAPTTAVNGYMMLWRIFRDLTRNMKRMDGARSVAEVQGVPKLCGYPV